MTEIKIAPYVAWQKMEDYIYIFDEKNKKLFFLKELSIDIWANIVQFKTVEEITKLIMDQYECNDENYVKESICDFIKNLKQEGILYAK